MKSKYYLFLVAITALYSCKKNDAETTQSDSRVLTPFSEQSLGGAQSAQQAPQRHNLFHENQTAGTPSVMTTNPPHGQPGHICGNGEGATTQSVPTSAAPQVQNTVQPTVTKTKVVTPKGMNPPHGEPGHVCGTAVGAPLNSKPSTTTASVTSGEVSKQITVGQPVPNLLAAPASASTETAEGMNPAHGQPNHVCGIAVGAPLPKK